VATERVTFQTRFDDVALTVDEAQEFGRRASETSGGSEIAGSIGAAIESGGPVVIADDHNPTALHILTVWLEDVGDDAVSSDLRQLRDTLAIDEEIDR
jgi:hypothetical protein